jgi:2-polyprenyl-6-methoxyphenol hydroxylase-like FAD-dependent oxidoreductase
VGDAGYFKDPLSAHGMSDALRDAELLARAMLAITCEDRSEAAALGQYESMRNAFAVPMLQLIDRIASRQWTDAEIKHLLMQLSKFMKQEVALLNELSDRVRCPAPSGLAHAVRAQCRAYHLTAA